MRFNISRRTALWLGGMLGTYTLLGAYLLPAIAVAQLPAWLHQQTGRPVQLQNLHLNPFRASVEIDGFAIGGDQNTALLSFDKLSLNLNLLGSLLRQAAVFDAIVLKQPVVNIEHYRDGRFNFSHLLEQTKSAAADNAESTDPSNQPALSIAQLRIENGQLAWLETPKHGPQTETLLPVNLSLLDFSSQSDTDSEFDLSFSPASGGDFHWHGRLKLQSLSSEGHLDLQNIALAKIWQMFLHDLAELDIDNGVLSLQADYQLRQQDAAWQIIVNNGALDISQLSLKDRADQQTLLDLSRLQLTGINLDSKQRQLKVDNLLTTKAQLNAWQDAKGLWNYQSLLPADQETHSQATAAPSPPPNWQIHIGQLKIDNYALNIVNTISRQAEAVFKNLSSQVADLNNQTTPYHWQLSFDLFEQGSAKISGTTTPPSLNSQLEAELSRFNLKPLQSLLDPYLNLEWIDGEINAKGNLTVDPGQPLQLQFKGDANLANLITRDKQKHKDFVKWANLQLEQIEYDHRQQSLSLNQVVFEQPYLRAIIKADGSSNFSELRPPSAKTQPTTQAADAASPPLNLRITKISLEDGQADFADNSLLLPFATEIKALNGELNDFVSQQDHPAELRLQGKVFDLAQVNIKGQHNLKSGDSDIRLSFTHLPLPLITPYMAEFSGYSIEKGQMALDLQYQIQHGELLAHNKLFIDQLTLGEYVDNPHAKSLPIKLAIALLKDSSGKINLDFPISGSLNDPHFNFETFIGDAAENLIAKITASPFKALGSLLDTEKDYSMVAFAPGSAALGAEQQQKLQQLSQALQSKPELGIEIKGVAYQNQDWPVIRFDSILEILKKMKSGELRDRGQYIRSEYIELSDSEYKRLLAKFFKEVFPDDISYSLLGAPRVKSQPDAEFYGLARQKLESAMPPEPPRLNNLAIARANAIAKYLVEQGNISRDRIYFLATDLKVIENTEINTILSLTAG